MGFEPTVEPASKRDIDKEAILDDAGSSFEVREYPAYEFNPLARAIPISEPKVISFTHEELFSSGLFDLISHYRSVLDAETARARPSAIDALAKELNSIVDKAAEAVIRMNAAGIANIMPGTLKLDETLVLNAAPTFEEVRNHQLQQIAKSFGAGDGSKSEPRG
jgi:hypothetical protein